MRVELQIW